MRRNHWLGRQTSRQINNLVLTEISAVDSLPPGAIIYSQSKGVNKAQYRSKREMRILLCLLSSQYPCVLFEAIFSRKNPLDSPRDRWNYDKISPRRQIERLPVARLVGGKARKPTTSDIIFSHNVPPLAKCFCVCRDNDSRVTRSLRDSQTSITMT